ncbi:hypothetical protein M9H77_35946 [Catharanthus roseus]|uniref:Uncharacterized protein n=1 Tax=Catharanthus roseus TaxID=4058 RepID=A0ACB9ZQE3_CATRO|nr:hypothetical protein M9H77_35946 [Catharanthus roseus]
MARFILKSLAPHEIYEEQKKLKEKIFKDSSKDKEGKLAYKSIKTINFFPFNSYLSLSLNLSFMCYEVSFVKLKLFLEPYHSHVSIIGDLCAILFGGTLFLVLSYASKCISSYVFLEDSLLHSSSMFDLSCHDFGVMNNASIESIVVGFGLDGALYDILHDKYLGKFVENVGYVSSFLDTTFGES